MTIWDTIATERRRLADDLEGLTDEQWTKQSQCEAWTVEEVATHVVLPFEISTARFGLTMLKNRGDLSKTSVQLTARLHAKTSRADAIRILRENADNRWTPPRLGPEIPLSEIIVHGQDIRRAVDLDHDIPADTIELALTGITDEEVRRDYAERIGV